MKIFSISLCLFCKKPWSNLVLALELAIAALAVMIVGNIYLYSTYDNSVLQNSQARVLYCSNFEYTSPNGASAFRAKLEKTKEKFPEVQGFSTFMDDWLAFNQEKLKNFVGMEWGEAAETFLMDDVSIKNLSLPISKGKWLTTELTPNGNIPCVMGGLYANRHYVGEVIPAYPGGVEHPGETGVMIEVVGILAQPVHLPNATLASTSSISTREIFRDTSNRILMAIVPENLVTLTAPMQEHSSAWVYVDKRCSPERLEEIRDSLTREYTNLDTDMIAMEQDQIGQIIQIMLPYIVLLFLVVLTGLLSASVLTTMKNMDVFKIYYLTGSSKQGIVFIMLLYILCFFAIAAFVFALALAWLSRNTWFTLPVADLDAYFLLNPSTLALILLVCAAVLVCSLVIPFVLLRKNDLSQLLRKE